MRHLFRRGVLLCAVVTLTAAGCSAPGEGTGPASDVKIDLAFQPDPPKVGDVETVVTLKDQQGQPIRGATVKLEGNMNHAGMEPSFAETKEAEPGQYRGTLKFTMGGDWFVLVTGTLPGGEKLKRKIDVPAVKSR